MLFKSILGAATLVATGIDASPLQELDARALTPAQCSKVVIIVEVLKFHKATPFCSSFLSVKPATSTSTILVTSTTTTTTTSTIKSGTQSTSIVFKPGNPPAKVRREANDAEPMFEARDAVVEKRDGTPTVPSYITAYATSAISSACSCLSIRTPTTTITTSSTTKVTKTVSASTTVQPVVTSTKYPCATPVPSKIPTLPYGLSNGAGVGETNNDLYGQGTTGTSLEGCCNLCYFGLPNCIQAFYYDYQGCVVQLAKAPTGSGEGVSSVCPNGKISGLTYAPDTSPPFRSTGNIAGPCGEVYNNL